MPDPALVYCNFYMVPYFSGSFISESLAGYGKSLFLALFKFINMMDRILKHLLNHIKEIGHFTLCFKLLIHDGTFIL